MPIHISILKSYSEYVYELVYQFFLPHAHLNSFKLMPSLVAIELSIKALKTLSGDMFVSSFNKISKIPSPCFSGLLLTL